MPRSAPLSHFLLHAWPTVAGLFPHRRVQCSLSAYTYRNPGSYDPVLMMKVWCFIFARPISTRLIQSCGTSTRHFQEIINPILQKTCCIISLMRENDFVFQTTVCARYDDLCGHYIFF